MQCLLQVLSEALTWMATAIQEFGLKQLDVKQLIEWMKADVNSTSAPVRTAAIALLAWPTASWARAWTRCSARA